MTALPVRAVDDEPARWNMVYMTEPEASACTFLAGSRSGWQRCLPDLHVGLADAVAFLQPYSGNESMQPKAYLSYAPSRQGAIFALFYLESGADILGWHIEARSGYFSAAFFMAENYYAASVPTVYRSVEDDVYGPWMIDYPPARGEIRRPIPEAASHELESMQSRFVEEWLFFADDPHLEGERAAYCALGLPVHEVNIKSRRLHRLNKEEPTWTYVTPGIDLNVVQLLKKYWRLCEKVPAS